MVWLRGVAARSTRFAARATAAARTGPAAPSLRSNYRRTFEWAAAIVWLAARARGRLAVPATVVAWFAARVAAADRTEPR